MSANKQLAIQFVNLNRPAALGIDNVEDFSLRFSLNLEDVRTTNGLSW